MDTANVIALAAAAISLIAFMFSWISYRKSNLQFLIINQSYLQADITTNITIPNNDRIIHEAVANDTMKVEGLNCAIALTNMGNIPLKYEVRKYDIYINDELKNYVDHEHDNNKGVLYPKQLLNYYMKTTAFQNNMQAIQYGLAKQMAITAWVIIDYNDLNNTHIKSIDRKLKFILHDNMIETRYLTFGDKI